jgi:hypothetical protein
VDAPVQLHLRLPAVFVDEAVVQVREIRTSQVAEGQLVATFLELGRRPPEVAGAHEQVDVARGAQGGVSVECPCERGSLEHERRNPGALEPGGEPRRQVLVNEGEPAAAFDRGLHVARELRVEVVLGELGQPCAQKRQ